MSFDAEFVDDARITQSILPSHATSFSSLIRDLVRRLNDNIH